MIRITTPGATLRTVLAAPKNQIAKYKVDDPTLQMFIYKYEPLVPWEQIQSKEQITEWIKTNLLPQLGEKIDEKAENNNYLKDLNVEEMFQAAPNDPQVQAAMQIYQRDPDNARTTLLRAINDNKKASFHQWWNYISETYGQHPGFAFSVLKPIIDSSDESTRDASMPLNAEAVALLYDNARAGRVQFNVLKMYKKESEKLDRESSKLIATGEDGTGWLNIPSKIHDEQNFPKNVDKLKRFSTGNGWCTASGMAEPYLSRGDFWLYLSSGTAKVAIRMEGENDIGEIRGKDNHIPFDYSQEIISFIEKQPFNKSSRCYADFQKIAEMNRKIATDPNEKATFIAAIKKNPFEFNKLLKNNRTPEMMEAADVGFQTILKQSAVRFGEIPPEFRERPAIRAAMLEGIPAAITTSYQYVDFINGLPETLKADPEVQQRIKAGITQRFANNPPSKTDWNALPEQYRNDPALMEGLAASVARKVKSTPDYFHDMPDEMKANPTIRQAALAEYEKYLPNHIKTQPTKVVWDKIPQDIQQKPEIREMFIAAAPAYLKNTTPQSAHIYSLLPPFVQTDPRMLPVAREFFAPFMKIPRNMQYVPEALRNDPLIRGPYQQNLMRYVEDYPQFIMEMPEEARQDPNVQKAFAKGAARYMQGDPDLFNKLPPELQQIPEVQQAYMSSMGGAIRRDPYAFYRVPNNMRRNQQFIDMAADMAVNTLQNNPRMYPRLHPILRNHPRVRRFFAEKAQQDPGVLPSGQQPPRQAPRRPGRVFNPPPKIQPPTNPIPTPPQTPPNVAGTWYKGIVKPR